MIHSPIDAPAPTLDARWIVALWVAVHGGRAASGGSRDLVLDANAARTAAGDAILALATLFEPDTAEALRTALSGVAASSAGPSDGQVEDALKRLGIRLFDATGAGAAPVSGVAVAGFGKIAWPRDPT